jgi:hypothetical protein
MTAPQNYLILQFYNSIPGYRFVIPTTALKKDDAVDRAHFLDMMQSHSGSILALGHLNTNMRVGSWLLPLTDLGFQFYLAYDAKETKKNCVLAFLHPLAIIPLDICPRLILVLSSVELPRVKYLEVGLYQASSNYAIISLKVTLNFSYSICLDQENYAWVFLRGG